MTTHSSLDPADRPATDARSRLVLEAIGGPTALLHLAGLRLLTDPTFDPPAHYPSDLFTLVKHAGPARTAEEVGAVDVVLLSHDEHADNLDVAGRRFLATAPLVLTTTGAVSRLGAGTSRPPWESIELAGPQGERLTVTWVPAQHGPLWATEYTGEVTGFVLAGPTVPTVYVSGDNSSLDVVRDIADRCGPVDVAVLFGGAGLVAPLEAVLTLTGDEAAEAARLLGARHVVVIHADGWTHLTEGRSEIEVAFERAGLRDRLVVPAPGEAVEL